LTFKPPFPDAAVEYIRIHQDDKSRSEIAIRIWDLFKYPCNKEGVKGVIRRLKKESLQVV
jgi:hypothetical protein